MSLIRFLNANLEDEEKRNKIDKEKLSKSQDTITGDIDREKNIIIEAKLHAPH